MRFTLRPHPGRGRFAHRRLYYSLVLDDARFEKIFRANASRVPFVAED